MNADWPPKPWPAVGRPWRGARCGRGSGRDRKAAQQVGALTISPIGLPPYMGTSMSRAKICKQAPLSFGRCCNVMSRDASYILAAHEALGKLCPFVPPVADGPGVLLISACGRRRARRYSARPERTRTTNITRHEAEPAFSGSVIVATSLHAVEPQQWIQTMMQIYASAARLRSSGAHPCIRHQSHRTWRATATSGRSWQIVAQKRQCSQN